MPGIRNSRKPNKKTDIDKRNVIILRAQMILSFALSACALITGELVISRWRGTSFVVTVTRLTSLALFLYGALCLMVLLSLLPRLARTLRLIWLITAVLMIISFVVVELVILSGSHSDFALSEDVPANYMIILGAGLNGTTPSMVLASRLDAALPLLLKRPDILCVVSGGQGEGEDIPEAEAMYKYLTARGVPPEQLLMESESFNTSQNIKNSLEVLERELFSRGIDGVAGRDVVVCSNGYHLFRARYLLRRSGVIPHALEAPLPLRYLVFTGYFREFFSVMLMWRP